MFKTVCRYPIWPGSRSNLGHGGTKKMTCIDIRPVSCALVSGNLLFFLAHFLFFFPFPFYAYAPPFSRLTPPIQPVAGVVQWPVGRLPRGGVEKGKNRY